MRRASLFAFALALIALAPFPVRAQEFTRNLFLGSEGDDVRLLQVRLNEDARTQLSVAGVGSPGEETTYFGTLTRAAVIRYQNVYASEILAPLGLASGTGF